MTVLTLIMVGLRVVLRVRMVLVMVARVIDVREVVVWCRARFWSRRRHQRLNITDHRFLHFFLLFFFFNTVYARWSRWGRFWNNSLSAQWNTDLRRVKHNSEVTETTYLTPSLGQVQPSHLPSQASALKMQL